MPSRPLLILSAAPNPRPISLPADYRQRVLRQFEERAAKYDAQGGNYHVPLANQLLELAALQRGEAALDVGAGTGFVALPAAAAVGPSGSVTAVDLSAAMLDQVRRLLCMRVPHTREAENTVASVPSPSVQPLRPPLRCRPRTRLRRPASQI